MSLISVRVGTNDLAKAKEFYDATFATIGVVRADTPAEYPIVLYKLRDGVSFVVGPARDGRPATPANGGTILIAAESQEAVSAWHATGLAHGATCEGQPEPKPQARGAFGAYLRDPDGNKLGVFHGIERR